MKKLSQVILISLILGGLVFVGCEASAEPIKLLFATFESEKGFMVEGVKAFARDLEKKTNGKVKVEISWAQALGKLTEYYDLVARGVCDVGFCVPFHAKGLFPMSELTALPWTFPTCEITTKALFELYKRGYMDKAFDKDVKTLWIAGGMADPFFTTDKPATNLADVKGLKVRTSGGVYGLRCEAMGTTPVFITGAEAYVALQKRVVNAMMIGWSTLPPWKLCEVVHYATTPVIGTVTFAMFMNKNTYNKLPKDVQKVIDEMSATNEYGLISARGMDKRSAEGKECFLNKGGKIVEWTPTALKELGERFAPIWDKWINDREAKELQARKTLDDFYSILKKLGVEQPTIGYTPGS